MIFSKMMMIRSKFLPVFSILLCLLSVSFYLGGTLLNNSSITALKNEQAPERLVITTTREY